MKIGLVGPSQSGKTTVLAALTGEPPGADALAGRSVTKVVRVPDARVEHLRDVYRPKSFKPATFEAVDFGAGVGSREAQIGAERESDALLVVLRAFEPGDDPAKQRAELETEWALADLAVIEKRIEKLKVQVLKPTKTQDEDKAELALLTRCAAAVSEGRPLRGLGLNDKDRRSIRHFGFLTLKPLVIVHNVSEKALPYPPERPTGATGDGEAVPICAKLEAELAELGPEERRAFLEDLGIAEPARDRLIRTAYLALSFIAFFTVGEDEVRAWTIERGTKAPQAAGAIHTDIERGFIRAEVVAYQDFKAAGGTMKAAKAANKVRLEGKEYLVQDGDIIEFRFSV